MYVCVCGGKEAAGLEEEEETETLAGNSLLPQPQV